MSASASPVEARPVLLIVEDEASIREPLVKYLANNQFRVKSVANAADARAMLSAHTFDLVIADIMMPGEDGLSLCRHIRSTSDLPVILLTARAEELPLQVTALALSRALSRVAGMRIRCPG